ERPALRSIGRPRTGVTPAPDRTKGRSLLVAAGRHGRPRRFSGFLIAILNASLSGGSQIRPSRPAFFGRPARGRNAPVGGRPGVSRAAGGRRARRTAWSGSRTWFYATTWAPRSCGT